VTCSRQLLDQVEVGFAVLDSALRYVEINPILAAINGVPADAHLGRTPREIVPGVADVVEQQLLRVLHTGRPFRHLELSGAVAGAAGQVRHWTQDLYPITAPDGATVGVGVLVWEITHLRSSQRAVTAREAAEDDARRIYLLQQLTAALATAVDTSQVAEVITSTVTVALGARAGTIAVRDDADRCRLVASTGLSDVEITAMRTVPAMGDDPVAAIMRARQPLLITSREEWDRRYPQLRGLQDEYEALAMLPLLVDGEPTGLLTFGWPHPRSFSPNEVALLVAVAGQTAIALERARLYDAERAALASAQRAQRRLALLAEVSERLVTATVESEQLRCLADLLVDGFADLCAVILPDDQGRLCRQTVRIVEPRYRPLEAALTGTTLTPLLDDDPRAIAWRTGRSSIADVPDVTPYLGDAGAAMAPGVAEYLSNGVSISATPGAPVYAVAAGTVEFAENLPGFGLCVILDHGGGHVRGARGA
jgi:GAF domain-containing protein